MDQYESNLFSGLDIWISENDQRFIWVAFDPETSEPIATSPDDFESLDECQAAIVDFFEKTRSLERKQIRITLDLQTANYKIII